MAEGRTFIPQLSLVTSSSFCGNWMFTMASWWQESNGCFPTLSSPDLSSASFFCAFSILDPMTGLLPILVQLSGHSFLVSFPASFSFFHSRWSISWIYSDLSHFYPLSLGKPLHNMVSTVIVILPAPKSTPPALSSEFCKHLSIYPSNNCWLNSLNMVGFGTEQ